MSKEIQNPPGKNPKNSLFLSQSGAGLSRKTVAPEDFISRFPTICHDAATKELPLFRKLLTNFVLDFGLYNMPERYQEVMNLILLKAAQSSKDNYDTLIFLELEVKADMGAIPKGSVEKITPLQALQRQEEKYLGYQKRVDFYLSQQEALRELCDIAQKLKGETLERFIRVVQGYKRIFNVKNLAEEILRNDKVPDFNILHYAAVSAVDDNIDFILYLELEEGCDIYARSRQGTPLGFISNRGLLDLYLKRKDDYIKAKKTTEDRK